MLVFRKKITLIAVLAGIVITPALASSTLEQSCAYFLNSFSVKDMPQKANADLQQCFQRSACAGDLGMQVSQCAQKLNAWQAANVFKIASTPPSHQKKSEKKILKKIAAPVVTPAAEPTAPAATSPATTITPETQPKNTQPQQPTEINWF
ncbi:MAG: hypothetical protein ACD_42C00520G0002 [uncultured bacterium]|nr:MAG: hypothetical protein ACD_42C00520G0002 [uncultured bacterium]OGT26659.1 MAG: hypothetical protein A3B71_03300 [Gammaproteobacteria bacterium RIFCSPHIGHO2_02_FULL_42_43]OGT27738.1 MAG: hypothetical protein A2624_06150 [Gammaproteobacteria bacterium RIFCSPHIGHO2_01_FULL_42_8]OGT53035.1 MAG: hypothetical protein A3E54_08225 [Gammaproteobacteria bacterium RIFCSPHIGHO2_12_FULL_41_25]OGT61192.1 MAG: hypothetical protein A3I77_07470 [Gammaproteobacteria bacterium RIFCSPLOWO2_02_FULL_42_14]OGT